MRHLHRLVWPVSLLWLAGLAGCRHAEVARLSSHAPPPPLAAVVPHATELHGETRVDDYFWLREKTNPAVLAHLHAENAYTDAMLQPTARLQRRLFREIVSHIKETDDTVPYRRDGWFYYSRTEKGKQYPILCRKRGSVEAREEIFLEVNQLARGKPFLGLGTTEVSDDGQLLVYSTDETGFRQYTLHIRDLRTGRDLPDRAEKVGSVAWAADNRTLFYTVEDHAKRQYRLYRHRLGAPADDVVYEETDERFELAVGRTRSRACLILTSASHTASEVRWLPAGQPEAEWRLIAPREPEHEYYADHHGEVFYIRSNKGGRNFRLVTAPMTAPGPANWKEVLPHRADVMLEGADLFAGHIVLTERSNGLPQLRVTALRDGATHYVQFPEAVYSAGPDANEEFDTPVFRYRYQSMVTPASVYDYDLDRREATLLKRKEVPGGFDPANYETRRLHATAADGTRVPVSLVCRKSYPRDGTGPLLLQGYGSYGIPEDIYFSPARLVLLDRGVAVAVAHVRGGGELGKAWHDQGRMRNKRNTFTDFIAVADFLVAGKWAARDRLVIQGGSAGGLLMGAVVNLRPDLCRAVVSHVPFVDVLNTMLDEDLPLTVGEFEEWGNPKLQADYDYMRTYSPYDNLVRGAYPAMLVKTSLHDSQVMYWEPAKYVAKLRTLKTDANPLLLKINLAAGHGGASGRYDHFKEVALDYAFMLAQMGVSGAPAR